ncbi:Protein CBR-THOC-3.2 [Caenorhabditis briggsae]|uniref:Protein CBR-THOC-3.2 n=1 Tax=Caenorhabditis briggsae TaxID=6238 RepID=H8WGY8_CAEBR|nr:Protein CBR-THOC-3.2 [Caenorhabditis briggsae]CCG58629.1 Protein CBR-THOC-3.2 [Caenorhabditis briggsae]
MTIASKERRCARLLTQSDATSYFEKYKRVRSTDMKVSSKCIQVQQCQSVAFNCDGTKLVCGAFDKKVSIANVDGGRLRFSWVGSSHTSSVEQVVACSEKQPNMFASASSDRNVCIWDARQSKPTHRITNKVGNFFVSWSPCDEYLIFLDKDNRVNTVDVRNYKVVNVRFYRPVSSKTAIVYRHTT